MTRPGFATAAIMALIAGLASFIAGTAYAGVGSAGVMAHSRNLASLNVTKPMAQGERVPRPRARPVPGAPAPPSAAGRDSAPGSPPGRRPRQPVGTPPPAARRDAAPPLRDRPRRPATL